MAIARGVAKKIAYKVESAWGTLPGPTGAKYLRRVTGNFNLTKDAYSSNEIRTDYQVADMRHGTRKAEGSLNGELSPSSYSDFMAAVVAKDFVVGGVTATMTITIATSGALFTITRTAGSFITDGLFVGNVARMTGGTLNAANASNNLLIVALTPLVATVQVLSNVALIPEGPITTVTMTVVGKQTFAPLTAHTDKSFTVEEWYSDIAQSEVYTGLKVGSMNVQLPATGLVTCDFGMQGKNLEQSGVTQYFTTPTNAGTNGILASVSGALIVNGAPVALITSLDFTVDRAMEPAIVVGSNFAADIMTGKIGVTGNFSTYFQDGVVRDYFNTEAVISLVVALSVGKNKTDDVISFTFPKIKVGSFSKADAELGIIASSTFTALLNDVTTSGLNATSIQIQDTSVV